MPTVAYIRPELHLNLIPILGIVNDWKNSILNVCLFIPLGLALPIGWKRFRKKRHAICFGFCLSLCIELLQILTFRTTDVNDVITNTLGAYLGRQIAKIIMTKKLRITGFAAKGKVYELFAVLLIVLCLMFFLYPFISAALWDWLLA
jgi:glycopeptide antibiotics resistance protein